eukprot:scpid30850/ scgid29887/ Tripartite motif-containing protein 45
MSSGGGGYFDLGQAAQGKPEPRKTLLPRTGHEAHWADTHHTQSQARSTSQYVADADVTNRGRPNPGPNRYSQSGQGTEAHGSSYENAQYGTSYSRDTTPRHQHSTAPEPAHGPHTGGAWTQDRQPERVRGNGSWDRHAPVAPAGGNGTGGGRTLLPDPTAGGGRPSRGPLLESVPPDRGQGSTYDHQLAPRDEHAEHPAYKQQQQPPSHHRQPPTQHRPPQQAQQPHRAPSHAHTAWPDPPRGTSNGGHQHHSAEVDAYRPPGKYPANERGAPRQDGWSGPCHDEQYRPVYDTSRPARSLLPTPDESEYPQEHEQDYSGNGNAAGQDRHSWNDHKVARGHADGDHDVDSDVGSRTDSRSAPSISTSDPGDIPPPPPGKTLLPTPAEHTDWDSCHHAHEDDPAEIVSPTLYGRPQPERDEPSASMASPTAVHANDDMQIEDDWADGVEVTYDSAAPVHAEKRSHDESADTEAKLFEQQRHAKAACTSGQWCAEHQRRRLTMFCTPCGAYVCRECTKQGGEHEYKDGVAHATVSVDEICEERRVRVDAQFTYLLQNLGDPLVQCKHQVKDVMQQLKINSVHAKRVVVEYIRRQAQRVETELVTQIDDIEHQRYAALYDQYNSIEGQLEKLRPIVKFARSVLADDSTSQFCDPIGVKRLADAEEFLCGVEFPSSTIEPCAQATLQYIPKEYGFPDQVRALGTLRARLALGDQCMAEGTGVSEAYRNERMTFILTAHDRHGDRMKDGGDALQCTWSDVPHDMGRVTPQPPEITIVDNHDGTYDVSYRFTSQKCGIYTMSVKMNGEDVYGAPFRINRGHWHLVPTCEPSTGVKLVEGHLKATARSSNQFVIGNRGFLHGQHTWKVTFEGGRFAVGVVGYVDPKLNEPWEQILRRSWSWCADGRTFHGPHSDVSCGPQSLDYAREVFVQLDCSARTLTLSRQLLEENDGDVKVDCIEHLPASYPLFPLLALRNGGTKLAVELI